MNELMLPSCFFIIQISISAFNICKSRICKYPSLPLIINEGNGLFIKTEEEEEEEEEGEEEGEDDDDDDDEGTAISRTFITT
jgi:hypothetical protein